MLRKVACTRNKKECIKEEGRRQDFYIEEKGKLWRRTEFWSIKLAFLCVQKPDGSAIFFFRIFHPLSTINLISSAHTIHKQKFAFVMWINKERRNTSRKRKTFLDVSWLILYFTCWRKCLHCSIRGSPAICANMKDFKLLSLSCNLPE
jgi:hypothetical protein